VVAEKRGCPLANRQTGDSEEQGGGASENKTLNFRVSPDFKKEYKGYAVAQGMTMTELLKEGFALSKKKRQK
jgi:hypothetical protein